MSPRAVVAAAVAAAWGARGHRRGFTLIELSIALALTVVLLAMATPSVQDRVQRQRLIGVGQGLAGDIAQGRHEAVRRGRTLHLVSRPGSRWCYALALSAEADCNAPSNHGATAAGVDPMLLRVVRADEHPGVELLDADALEIGQRQGLPLQATGRLLFRTVQGLQLRVQLSPLGRTGLCTPAAAIPGVAPCLSL